VGGALSGALAVGPGGPAATYFRLPRGRGRPYVHSARRVRGHARIVWRIGFCQHDGRVVAFLGQHCSRQLPRHARARFTPARSQGRPARLERGARRHERLVAAQVGQRGGRARGRRLRGLRARRRAARARSPATSIAAIASAPGTTTGARGPAGTAVGAAAAAADPAAAGAPFSAGAAAGAAAPTALPPPPAAARCTAQ